MANFSKMYEQYVEQVYCFLRGLSGDDSFAEELTRKTFYQAFLHVDSFENCSSVFEWLCEIGKNVYLREMKRQKKMDPGKRQIPVFEEETFSSKCQIPAFEGEVSGGEGDAAERKKRIRRGLRRIRRRWVCFCLVMTVILLMLVGVIVGGSCLYEYLFCGGGAFGK